MTARDDYQSIASQGRLLGSKAWADVFLERCRQVDVEGFDATRDDTYAAGELVRAAVCYALQAVSTQGVIEKIGILDALRSVFAKLWPWDQRWWKTTKPRRDLVKAAALLIAEIERLDRASEKHT